MAFLTEAQWSKYKEVINNFHEDAFQQTITWKKSITHIDEHGEDLNNRFIDIELKGLIQYNYFRAWPITQTTDTGEIDKENMLLYLNIKWLKDNNFTNNGGFLDYNPDYDRFVIDGITYKPMGDSKAAQAKDDALLFFIILKREELQTGEDRY